jgi:inner membrane protein
MRNSAIARLIVMAVLALALLLPLSWVWSIVSERAARRNEAVGEVSTTWGGPQTLAGPVLTVPYIVSWTDSAGRPQRGICRAYFLPRDLHVRGTLDPQTRKRGIFEVIVYEAELAIDGRFAPPDLSWIRPAPESIEWQNATISIGVSEPKGLARRVSLRLGDDEAPFSAGTADVGLFQTGIEARVPRSEALQQRTDLTFSLTLAVNGTRDIRFLPAAGETSVDLTSAWPHPSFVGSPLPDHRAASGGGFTAQWQAPDFGRAYPARWTSGAMDRDHLLAQARASAFGVSLVQPVDIYHQAERAVKYAALFVVLTFLVFFLWEVFHAALLHPMQYAFVGFALCVFYLLLVSISEHAGFDTAYSLSAGVTTLLITGYARAVLRGRRQAASVLASLASLYGFLYLLLRLEDYALLAGSVGLFVILAAVMYATRRMDWYSLRLGVKPDQPTA